MKAQISGMTLSIVAFLAVFLGISVFTFDYAEGTSYFSDDPNACINCHVMREQYTRWTRSSHQAVATCNDCHVPHDFIEKWFIKGLNGWNHSLAFTLGNFPDTILIRDFNAEIAEENCVACHLAMVSNVHRAIEDEALSCVACHGNVGHGR